MTNTISSSTTRASKFLKNIISMLSSMVKAKSLALRDKTNGLKARLVVLSLLRNKKFSLGTLTHKIEAVLNHKHEFNAEVTNEEDDRNKSIILYNASSVPSSSTHEQYHEYYYNNEYENDDVDKYPDLRHSLFDDEDRDELDLGDPNESVIDLVRNSKEEGEDFKLEDEINHVADLFILKFHKRMKLQKLESFKRYQEMLQRGA